MSSSACGLRARNAGERQQQVDAAARMLTASGGPEPKGWFDPQWTYVNCSDMPDRPSSARLAEIAREGYETGKSLHDIVVKEKKLLTQEKWDEVFSFENLINPDATRD